MPRSLEPFFPETVIEPDVKVKLGSSHPPHRLPFFNTFEKHKNRFLYLEPEDNTFSSADTDVHRNRAQLLGSQWGLDLGDPGFESRATQLMSTLENLKSSRDFPVFGSNASDSASPAIAPILDKLGFADLDGDDRLENRVFAFDFPEANDDAQNCMFGMDETDVLTHADVVAFLDQWSARVTDARSNDLGYSLCTNPDLVQQVQSELAYRTTYLQLMKQQIVHLFQQLDPDCTCPDPLFLDSMVYAHDFDLIIQCTGLPWVHSPPPLLTLDTDHSVCTPLEPARQLFLDACRSRFSPECRRTALQKYGSASSYAIVVCNPLVSKSGFTHLVAQNLQNIESHAQILRDLSLLETALLESVSGVESALASAQSPSSFALTAATSTVDAHARASQAALEMALFLQRLSSASSS